MSSQFTLFHHIMPNQFCAFSWTCASSPTCPDIDGVHVLLKDIVGLIYYWILLSDANRSALVLYGFGDCFISLDSPVISGLWLPCDHLQNLGKWMIKHKTMCLFWLTSGFCLLLKLVNYSSALVWASTYNLIPFSSSYSSLKLRSLFSHMSSSESWIPDKWLTVWRSWFPHPTSSFVNSSEN